MNTDENKMNTNTHDQRTTHIGSSGMMALVRFKVSAVML